MSQILFIFVKGWHSWALQLEKKDLYNNSVTIITVINNPTIEKAVVHHHSPLTPPCSTLFLHSIWGDGFTLMFQKKPGQETKPRSFIFEKAWCKNLVLKASPTWWTWVWVSSRSWWWTGRPGVLQSMGLQRVRHNWETKLNWTKGHLRDFPDSPVAKTSPPMQGMGVWSLVGITINWKIL